MLLPKINIARATTNDFPGLVQDGFKRTYDDLNALLRRIESLESPTNTTSDGISTASYFVSTVITGTAPFQPNSTTVCTNLNADLLDGSHAAAFESANANIQSHISSTSNPHSVTKSQVGLGSVENTALSTWAGTTNITTLGTITGGTWSATTIAIAKGGTGATSLASGYVPYSSGGTAYAASPIYTDGTSVSIGTTGLVSKFHTASGVNAAPATSGTSGSGIAARVSGADNAVIDFGTNSGTYTWIQSRDLSTYATNYPLAVNPNGGNVGIGLTTGISARVHAQSTTEQIRASYSATQYLSITVDSLGAVTFDSVGTGPWFTFNDSVQIKNVALLGTGASANGSLYFYNSTNAYRAIVQAPNTTTADKTITLPDATGTVALTTGSTFTSGTIGGSVIINTSGAITTTSANGFTAGAPTTVLGKITLYTAGDIYSGTIQPTDPLTVARTWTFPNATGTVALTTGSTFSTGSVWNGAAIAAAYLGGHTHATADINDLTYATTGITKVGTINTGIWQGTAIAKTYIGVLDYLNMDGIDGEYYVASTIGGAIDRKLTFTNGVLIGELGV